MNEARTLAGTLAVNGRFLGQSTTGVQRYAFELLQALDGLLQRGSIPRVPVTVFTPAGTSTLPEYSFLQVRRHGRLDGHLWEQFELAAAARGSLLFTPCGGAPVVHRDHVITIHDAAPFVTPQAYTAMYRSYYKPLQTLLARTARHILTVSEFSRRELARSLHVRPEKIKAIHESGEHILRSPRSRDIVAKHGLVPGNYVLAVGSMNPNKNLRGLMRAASLLRDDRIQVAIVGGMNSRIFSEAENVSDSLVPLGVVSDAELRALYESAGCFVFPSFYEGFGLPPLEALTLGCPVVASRAAALPEVLGDAAVYCDPASAEDIAAQIRHVMQGGGPSRAVRQAHVGAFTWERCARETWAVLLRAMGMDASGSPTESVMRMAADSAAERIPRAG
jgi:glycosyltransferase involved in cell wall biosynthesis